MPSGTTAKNRLQERPEAGARKVTWSFLVYGVSCCFWWRFFVIGGGFFGLVWFCKILEKSHTRQLSRCLANCRIKSASPLIFVID